MSCPSEAESLNGGGGMDNFTSRAFTISSYAPTMIEDYTTRVPAEMLDDIVDWLDERRDMHATAHVCRRWRHVALNYPRRHCWFNCGSQFIYEGNISSPAAVMLCVAQLKCRSGHSKRLALNLDDVAVEVADTILELVGPNLPQVEDLDVEWYGERFTEKIFRALSSHPAPRLTTLSLDWHPMFRRGRRCGSTPRIPQHIFAGSSAALREVSLYCVDLPVVPMPQFSAAKKLSFTPDAEKGKRWPFQDLIAPHFPAVTDMELPFHEIIPLAVPTTVGGTLLLGRLTRVEINEMTLLDAIDGFPDWSSVSHIVAHPHKENYFDDDSKRPAVPGLLQRMLADFAHEDFRVEVKNMWPDRQDTTYDLTLSSDAQPADGRIISRKLNVPLALLRDGMQTIFESARAGGHELRLTRATLTGDTFTALWPVLPAHELRGVKVLADPALPDIPRGVSPRKVPRLRNLVIARHWGVISEERGPIPLEPDGLGLFLRATLCFPARPHARLILSNVSADGLAPEVGSAFTAVVTEHYLRLTDW